MAFTPRTSVTNPTDLRWHGEINDANKYYYDYDNYNAGAQNGLYMPNCTTYAFGRASEIAGRSCRNYTILNRNGFGEASTWLSTALWETGSTPELGAIAVWVASNHVAIVEAMSNGRPSYFSMSGYVTGTYPTVDNPGTSSPWYFKYLDWDTTISYYGQPDGYIYNPYVDGGTPPEPGQYTICVYPSDGNGTTSPNGCKTQDAGTTMNISASPFSGSTFNKWSDGNTSPSRTVTFDANKTYIAYFNSEEPEPDKFYLYGQASPAGAGRVYGDKPYYSYGETCICTAEAYGDYEFIEWGDGYKGNPRWLEMTQDHRQTAIFAKFYDLTLKADPEKGGSVSGGGHYRENAQVQISAKANKGYQFVRWSDGNTSAVRVINLTGDMTLTAYFKLKGCPVFLNHNGTDITILK